MLHPRLALAAALSLGLTGCDFNQYTDNGQVRVKNRTDDTIVVHYETEVVTAIHDCDCDGEADEVDLGLTHEHATIPSGKEEDLLIDSFDFWDGSITVEYDGLLRDYDVDFSIWGFDTIWVREDDFVPTGNG